MTARLDEILRILATAAALLTGWVPLGVVRDVAGDPVRSLVLSLAVGGPASADDEELDGGEAGGAGDLERLDDAFVDLEDLDDGIVNPEDFDDVVFGDVETLDDAVFEHLTLDADSADVETLDDLIVTAPGDSTGKTATETTTGENGDRDRDRDRDRDWDDDDDDRRRMYGQKRKKKGLLSEMFEFGD